jgi:hypothetical protein
MNHEANILFESIESALQFVTLMSEVTRDTRARVEAHKISHVRLRAGSTARIGCDSDLARLTVALHLVSYNLDELELHLGTSHRVLNDLRSLRRLLMRERAAMPARPKPMSLVSKEAA